MTTNNDNVFSNVLVVAFSKFDRWITQGTLSDGMVVNGPQYIKDHKLPACSTFSRLIPGEETSYGKLFKKLPDIRTNQTYVKYFVNNKEVFLATDVNGNSCPCDYTWAHIPDGAVCTFLGYINNTQVVDHVSLLYENHILRCSVNCWLQGFMPVNAKQ